MSWQANAKCRGVSPAIFYPEGSGRGNAREAKAICAGCPVQISCLEWAIEHRETLGVWGGLTAGQRDHLHRRRGPRTVRCIECDAEFERPPGRSRQQTCSFVCWEQRRLRRDREHAAMKRRTPGEWDRGHGTISRYQSGCRCMACAGVARATQRINRAKNRLNSTSDPQSVAGRIA